MNRTRPADPLWTPDLATCSYFDYQRGWGTAVRVAPPIPGVRLPNPRWTDLTAWPKAAFLIPKAFTIKGLTDAERAARYYRDLERVGAKTIANALRDLPVEDDRLCLLCFCRTRDVLRDPWTCHRRWFAQWWQVQTGMEVPELTYQNA